jgi:putative endonuclease
VTLSVRGYGKSWRTKECVQRTPSIARAAQAALQLQAACDGITALAARRYGGGVEFGGAWAERRPPGPRPAQQPNPTTNLTPGASRFIVQRVKDVWFVYVVRCADDSLYTGIARDVTARLAAHNAGRGARYTRGRGPLVLCAAQRCNSKGEALRLEHRIKRLRRAEKETLTRSATGLKRLRARLAA